MRRIHIAVDYCSSCDTPLHERVYIPDDWQFGDPLPEGLTFHQSSIERISGKPPFAMTRAGDKRVTKDGRSWFDA